MILLEAKSLTPLVVVGVYLALLLAFAMLMAESRRPQIAMLIVPLIAASLPLLAMGSRP